MRIGIDFDNTIAGYDELFLRAAQAAKIVDSGFSGDKLQVRDYLRSQPDGEHLWQMIQGRVYGFHMPAARLIEGVADFFVAAKLSRIELVIISHKTRYGHYDRDKIDLRQQALTWMHANGFFDQRQFGLSEEAIYFESTQAAKVARIQKVAPDFFIDDLPEVLLATDFPSSVKKILFVKSGPSHSLSFSHSGNWLSIKHYLIGP